MSRLGLRIPKEEGWPRAIELAEISAANGIDSFWVPEAWARNQVILMTKLTEQFGQVDVCSGILNIYSRTPSLIAMTAAGLDDLSTNSMFRLGLGTSGPHVVENFHGQSFESPLRRTREYIEIINTLLSGEELNYHGKFFDLEGYSLKGVDEPYDIPIYLASMGEKNLELTGEFADGWLPAFVPLNGFESSYESIETGAARQDRSLQDIDIAPFIITCISSTDPQQSREVVRDTIAFYVGAFGPFYHGAVSRAGFADEADRIRDLWNAGNRDEAREAVTTELLESLAIYGTPENASELLQKYLDAGADMPIARIPDIASSDMVTETVTQWSKDLL